MGLATSTFSIVRGLLGPWNTAAFMGKLLSDPDATSLRADRSRGAAFGLLPDRAPGRRPAVEADRQLRDVGEPHLAEHVGRERGALTAGAVDDDALRRIDLARVIVRGRVEPEFEQPAGHVRRAGNEAELAPLADVANVHHLDAAAGHLGLELLDRKILDPRLRFLDHLPDRFLRLPHGGLLSALSSHRRRARAMRSPPQTGPD